MPATPDQILEQIEIVKAKYQADKDAAVQAALDVASVNSAQAAVVAAQATSVASQAAADAALADAGASLDALIALAKS